MNEFSDNRVNIICGNCGTVNPPDKEFCINCGANLDNQQVDPYAESSQPYGEMNQEQKQWDGYNEIPVAVVGAAGVNQGNHQNNQYDNNYHRNEYQNNDYQNNDYQSNDYQNTGREGNRQPKSMFNTNFILSDYDEKMFDSSDNEVNNFIFKNQSYYFRVFEEMRAMNKATSWNWAAFFFPSIWLVYRKMYVLGIVTFLTVSVIGSFTGLGFILSIAVGVLWGLFGNVKYLEYMDNSFIEANRLDGNMRSNYLNSKGGVNVVAVVVLIVLFFGLIIIPTIIMLLIFLGLAGMN